jgi:hypothetical protein
MNLEVPVLTSNVVNDDRKEGEGAVGSVISVGGLEI